MSIGHLVIWSSGHRVIESSAHLVVSNILTDCTILMEHRIICALSESCFGDLIEQSGYLVVTVGHITVGNITVVCGYSWQKLQLSEVTVV